MDLPFTKEQFIEVIAEYNSGSFPALIIFSVLAVVGAILLFTNYKNKNKIISGILGVSWVWTGIVYHILYFSGINNLAWVFGTLFVLQGGIFLFYSFNEKINFYFKPSIYSYTGLFFIVFALVIYPLLGLIFGHAYPGVPIFPLPCPLVIFTFGILLMTNKTPKYILIIPLLWGLLVYQLQ